MLIDTLIEQFKKLHSPYDLARLFNTTKSRLFFNLYISPEERKYKKFFIPKKGGGRREITAPNGAIKSYQSTLNIILSHYYLMLSKSSVHGFVYGRSIKSNAKLHRKSNFVLNLDLKNFFPAINFGRVRGLFLSFPFYFNPKIATLLAQICTSDNQLPQGAPTSPIISNFICLRLDKEISRFAKINKCTYTRYADDITISTFLRCFPVNIAQIENYDSKQRLTLSSGLRDIIIANGFEINSRKTRLANHLQHQEVTGLTVNRKLNVNKKMLRSVKSMLHAWEKYNYEFAALEHFDKYSKKFYNPEFSGPSFKKILKGKIDFIGMVRGPSDRIFLKYLKRYKDLTIKPPIVVEEGRNENFIIIGEGKTDGMHLKAAINALQSSPILQRLSIYVQEIPDSANINDSVLLKSCRAWSNRVNKMGIICMFDSDVQSTVNNATEEILGFKYWGNKVYSFVLPTPDHRQDDPELCVELYYSDKEIMTADQNGRRLYLNSEFDHKTLCHKSDPDIHCTERNKVKRRKPSIIDDGVILNERNIALSKNSFARNIVTGVDEFASFDFTQFLKIFKIVDKIRIHALGQAGG